MRDQAGSGGEDMRRRTVVALEPDDAGAREILLEAQDVADLGATPAVDRLVVVADAAEVAVALRQEAQPEVLRDVGVLVLVDQDVAEAPRSEEHTSELQSLMRISYAVFCLKKKT